MTAIAGLDTATDDVSVAVVRDGEVVDERLVPKPDGGRPRHAEALLVELEGAVGASGGWDAVDRLAIGIGPGSFTGLRVGLATARAIAQALSKPVVPVGTLAALAAGIAEGGGEGRPRLAMLDGRRGEAFTALFGPGGEEVWYRSLRSRRTSANGSRPCPTAHWRAVPGRYDSAVSWRLRASRFFRTRARRTGCGPGTFAGSPRTGPRTARGDPADLSETTRRAGLA